MKKIIASESDIRLMVESFYTKVQGDDLLFPIFERIVEDWEVHFVTMTKFWSAALLNIRGYNGRPFPPHMKMGLSKEHFSRWVALFTANIEEQFEGEVAEEAVRRANLMSQLFQHKLDSFRDGMKPIL